MSCSMQYAIMHILNSNIPFQCAMELLWTVHDTYTLFYRRESCRFTWPASLCFLQIHNIPTTATISRDPAAENSTIFRHAETGGREGGSAVRYKVGRNGVCGSVTAKDRLSLVWVNMSVWTTTKYRDQLSDECLCVDEPGQGWQSSMMSRYFTWLLIGLFSPQL